MLITSIFSFSHNVFKRNHLHSQRRFKSGLCFKRLIPGNKLALLEIEETTSCPLHQRLSYIVSAFCNAMLTSILPLEVNSLWL